MGVDQAEAGNKGAKNRKPRQTKAQKEEARRREEAVQLDAAGNEFRNIQKELRVLRVVDVNPLELVVNPEIQGRYRDVGEDDVLKLADSMRTQGQLSPIQVRDIGDGRYEVVFGVTRTKAGIAIRQGYPASDLVKGDIPANPEFTLRAEVVDISDDEARLRNFHENANRTDLSPMDQCNYVHTLLADGYTGVQIAQMFGFKDSASVTRLKALRDLIDIFKDKLHKGELTAFSGFQLAKLPSEAQERVAAIIQEKKLAKLDKEGNPVAGKADPDSTQDFTGDERDKWSMEDIRSAIAQYNREQKAKETPPQGDTPTGGGDTVPGATGGETPPTPTPNTNTNLSVKAIRDGLTAVRDDEGTPSKAKVLAGLLLEWVEGRAEDGVKAWANFARLHLADEDAPPQE